MPEVDNKIIQQNKIVYEEIGRDEFIKKMIIAGYDQNEILDLDKNRLLRRMNIVQQTGKVISYWQKQEKKHFLKEGAFEHIIINPQREELYQNINHRFENIIQQGAIDEVENLIKEDDFSFESQIAKTIGFSEIYQYLCGDISKSQMIYMAQKKTRNFAKRQITWFKNQF